MLAKRLLTAQRLRKIAHMRWDDFSPEGVWTVRSAEREKGNVGKVQSAGTGTQPAGDPASGVWQSLCLSSGARPDKLSK